MSSLGYGTLEENLQEETVEDKSGEQNVVNIPKEPFKTFLSGLFLLTGFLATTVSLSVTHDHVPLTPSLPDEVLDHVGYLSWGLTASEAILIINVLMAVTVVILHHHRLIILRRVWFLLGLLYYYRSLTMFVTILPKPDKNYKCMVEEDHVTFFIIVKRVLHIISGGGLSVNGKHVYCGDYIFSGHTFTLVMAYLVIREYSPSSFCLLHHLSLVLSLLGVVFLLSGRGHYTIDVLLAYWAVTRTWWMYHLIASDFRLKKGDGKNQIFLDNLIWWRAARFMEINAKHPLPEIYGLT